MGAMGNKTKKPKTVTGMLHEEYLGSELSLGTLRDCMLMSIEEDCDIGRGSLFASNCVVSILCNSKNHLLLILDSIQFPGNGDDKDYPRA